MKITVNFPPKNVLAWTQNNLALLLKASSLIVAVAALYFQDLRLIFMNALTDEATSYILIIPFLFAYLVYRKRGMLRAAMSDETGNGSGTTKYLDMMGGILLCTTAFFLYWYGSYTFTPLEYHMLTLPLFAAGLTLVFFGSRTLRQACFLIVFLAFFTPLPSQVIYSFGSTLSVASSEASNRIVNLLGVHSTMSSLSGTPAITITQANGTVLPPFAVDIACSGIFSLMGFFVFAAFVAFIVRDKLWKKLFLFLIGLLLIYIINIARITTILMIGYQLGEQTALQVFHLLGGWILIFIGTLFLLIFAERILHTQIFSKSTEKCSGCNPKPEKDHDFCLSCGRILKPIRISFRKLDTIRIVAVATIVILLVSIQVPVFALTNGPAQIMVQTSTGEQGNKQLLPQIPGYEPTFLYRDTDFEKLSGQEASLIYVYESLDMIKEPIYVAVEIASTTGPLHSWEYCINGPGRPVYGASLDLRDTQILDNPPIVARYFAFQWVSTNQTEVVLYWYESAIFKANDTAQQKQVEISLITYPDSPQNLTRIEELLPFATAIAQYWEPIKTWSQIALVLSQQSLTLAAATGIPIPVIAVLYLLRRRNQRKANTKTYLKLAKPTRDIIDTVSETEKTASPTLGAIVATFKNRTGESIEDKKMLERLIDAEKAGIIKNEIANVQDQPTRIWKTQMTSRLHLASVTRFIRIRFSKPTH